MSLRSIIYLPLLFGLSGCLLADTSSAVAPFPDEPLPRLQLVLHQISCPAKKQDVLAKIRAVVPCEWILTRGGNEREFALYSVGGTGAERYGVELEHPYHLQAYAKVQAAEERVVTRVRLVFRSESVGLFYCPDIADRDADFPRQNGQANPERNAGAASSSTSTFTPGVGHP